VAELYLTGKWHQVFRDRQIRYVFEETADSAAGVVAVQRRHNPHALRELTPAKMGQVKALFRVPEDELRPLTVDLFSQYLRVHDDKIKNIRAAGNLKGVKNRFPAAPFI
jgi:hypothetical protein